MDKVQPEQQRQQAQDLEKAEKTLPLQRRPTRNRYTRRARAMQTLGCGVKQDTRIGAFADHKAGKVNVVVGKLVVALSVDDAEQLGGEILTEAEEVQRVIDAKKAEAK